MTLTEKARLERDYQELSERSARRRQEAVGERSLCWLALLPEWSAALAEACGFPTGPEPLERMLERAEAAGLCRVRRDPHLIGDPTIRFWMTSATRSWLFEQWQADGSLDLREEIEEIASGIRDVHIAGELEISPGVLRWAELALGELATPVVAGEVLAGRVNRSLKEGDTSAAGEWIFAADALAVPLGVEMRLAAARAKRQLNLHYRQLQDARYVAEFVRRKGQIREMRRLLSEDEDHWAVHFIGQSGVGKTMLMRYLTGRLPGADPYTFAARVDFDYLDPRFPLEAPAHLLQELGEGLAANLTDANQEAKYRSFREAVTRADAAKHELTDPELLTSPQFEEVVATFAIFVKSLPEPVVLILDTCEELAKLHPPGEDIPSIRAMFKILEQVHAAAPSVRVVFAGRRWLTREAANKVRLAMPPAVEKMEPRPYMRMHAVLGFTRDEATEYLRKARKLDLSDEMVEAILKLTFDPGVPPSMDKEAHGPVEEPHYSPSDVALFAGWIERERERERDLKPEELDKGNRDDPYVEVRIFEKIESREVLAAIPAVALLERFDVETIRPALEGESRAQGRAIDGLIEQEWTHLEDGADPDEMVISVDSGLLRRLTRYFDRDNDRRRQREDARKALTPHLTKMFKRPTSEVPPDRIDSAVRALPIETTLKLLDRMEERVVGEPAWPWAESVCGFLLSDEREPQLPPPLMAPVRALYVAALGHRRASVDLISEQWEAVTGEAPEHPDRNRVLALQTRGRLGAAASNGGYRSGRVWVDLAQGRRMLHRRAVAAAVAPGLLAAVEAIIDRHEKQGQATPVDGVRECLAALLEHFKENRPVWAYVLALEGRIQAVSGDWDGARETFERLEDMRPEDVHGEPRFADWVPPRSIGHRTLLELLRFRLADCSESAELVDRCEEAALERPGDADGAHLLSLVLQARLAHGGLTEDALLGIAAFEEVLDGYEVTAAAHRVAAPLFVSLAEAWLSVGLPARALDLLADREQAAASRRNEEDSNRAAALATIRIVRMLRSRERLGLIGSFSSAADDDLRSEALAAGAVIAGLRPPPSLEVEDDHVAWRARNLLDPKVEEEALRAMLWRRTPKGNDAAALHTALDRLEAALIQRQWAGVGRLILLRARLVVRRLAVNHHSAASISEPIGDEALRLRLRLCALLGDAEWPDEPNRLRQVGRLALKEGELLALRLPRQAAPMLRFAARCLQEAGHAHGAFFSTLLGAIADVHAGEVEAARGRREELVELYEEIRKREPGAPPVERMLLASSEDRAGRSANSWPGWTQRFGAYLHWCEGTEPDSTSAELNSEPELTLAPAAGASGSSVPSGPLAGSRQAVVIAFLVFVLGGAMFGAFVGPALGSQAFIAAGALAAAVALVSVLVIVEAVARSVPLAILPVDGFDVSIAPAPRREGSAGTVKARVDPWARRWFVSSYFHVWKMIRPRSRWEALITPSNEEIARLPGPLALAVKPRRGGGFKPVRLAVTSDLAPLAWEWRLAGHLTADKKWDPWATPEIRRVRPSGYFGYSWGPPLPSPIAAAVSPAWRPFVQSAAPSGVEWASTTSDEPARAAIALGFPVRTRAGWRLRLDDELTASSSRLDRTQPQWLLSPDRLVRKAPIAIVVARPGGRRLASDQRVAEGLRGFANETFLAGAHAVIAVPALPPERTADLIELLTGEISAWEETPDAERLLHLASRLRAAVFRPPVGSWALEGEADSAEREKDRLLRAQLAFDVCLFAPD